MCNIWNRYQKYVGATRIQENDIETEFVQPEYLRYSYTYLNEREFYTFGSNNYDLRVDQIILYFSKRVFQRNDSSNLIY